MHSMLRAACVATVTLAFAVPAFAAPPGAQAVDAAWMKAMKANDLDGVVKTYAPDAIAWLPNSKEARGQQAIRAAYEGLLRNNTVKDVVLKDTAYRTVGTTSTGWGHFELTLQPKAGGNPVTMTGRFTAIAQSRKGHWVYVVDHASAEPADATRP